MMNGVPVKVELYSVLSGHTGDINCCAWSPVTKNLLCSGGGGDYAFRVWDISKSKEKDNSALLHTIPAHKYYINACVFNPSGDLVATASSDEAVKLWSTASWTLVGELNGHDAGVKWCSFSPDGNLLATASDDASVKVWEVGALRCIATLRRGDSSMTCCCFAPNGWLLLTGSSSGELLLFNAFTGKCVNRVLGAHDIMGINAIALDAASAADIDGQSQNEIFASAGFDGIIKIWSVRSTNEKTESATVSMVSELIGHSAAVYTCVFHPSLRILASGSADQTVILWDLESRSQITRLQAHNRYVIHMSFSPCGLFMTTSSSDRTIKVWSIVSGGGGESETVGDHNVNEDKSTTSQSVTSSVPSLISAASWSLEEVCKWVETLAKQQERGQAHPDDVRAAERLSLALEQLSVSEVDKPGCEELKCPITCEVIQRIDRLTSMYETLNTELEDVKWRSRNNHRRCSSPSQP